MESRFIYMNNQRKNREIIPALQQPARRTNHFSMFVLFETQVVGANPGDERVALQSRARTQ